jgi:hypothetical protein
MAIRPGVTGRTEAIELLRRHVWVDQVTNHTPIAYQMAGVPVDLPPGWKWSRQNPAGIDTAVEGILGMRDEVVDYFELSTRFRVGDLRLLLGRPDLEQRWSWVMSQGTFFKVSAWYSAARLEIIFEGRCPNTRFYDYPVIIRLRRSAPEPRPDAVQTLCQPH